MNNRKWLTGWIQRCVCHPGADVNSNWDTTRSSHGWLYRSDPRTAELSTLEQSSLRAWRKSGTGGHQSGGGAILLAAALDRPTAHQTDSHSHLHPSWPRPRLLQRRKVAFVDLHAATACLASGTGSGQPILCAVTATPRASAVRAWPSRGSSQHSSPCSSRVDDQSPWSRPNVICAAAYSMCRT